MAMGMTTSHGLRLMIFSIREWRPDWRMVFRLLPAVASTSFVMEEVWDLLRWRAGYLPLFDPGPSRQLVNNFIPIFLIQCGWAGFYLGACHYRRQQQSEKDLLQSNAARREAELRALKAQINPHFLFNSLNTLRALIPSDLERPREVVTLLSDLLRTSLASGQQATVPCRKELATVDDYLRLEQFRFETRLRVRMIVSAEALECPVPPFLIQGLVENAIKHGIALQEEGGEIAIEIGVRDGAFHAAITNPGRIDQTGAATGLGLKNARERLRFLFGSEARLELGQKGDGLVVAEVVIPQFQGEPVS